VQDFRSDPDKTVISVFVSIVDEYEFTQWFAAVFRSFLIQIDRVSRETRKKMAVGEVYGEHLSNAADRLDAVAVVTAVTPPPPRYRSILMRPDQRCRNSGDRGHYPAWPCMSYLYSRPSLVVLIDSRSFTIHRISVWYRYSMRSPL
jgi:hypothetical protein